MVERDHYFRIQRFAHSRISALVILSVIPRGFSPYDLKPRRSDARYHVLHNSWSSGIAAVIQGTARRFEQVVYRATSMPSGSTPAAF